MSIWSSLDPASATVDPGGSVSVTLRLRNTTDLVEEYRIAVAGEPAIWSQVEPPAVRLYPGASGTSAITFRPPRSPDAAAGGHPFAVEVTPAEQPADKAVVEGHLTITPFSEIRAELLPHTVRGRFRGKPKFAVDNLGNTRLVASLTGTDTSRRLGFELYPANVQVEPGRAAWVKGKVRPGQIAWFGHKETHPYAINILRSGVEPVEVNGDFLQLAVMPRWLLGFMSVLVACIVAFVIAWFAFAPQLTTRAQEVADSTQQPLVSETPNGEQTPKHKKHTPKEQPTKPQQPPGGQQNPGGGHKPKPKRGEIVGPSAAGKCLDVSPNLVDNAHPVQVYDCNKTIRQQWTLAKDGTIRALGQCMDIHDNATDAGTKIILWTCNGVGGQQWRPQPDGSILNPQSKLCLDDPNDVTDNETQLQIWGCNGQEAQQWKVPK